jgi:hypothetical protein
VWNGVEVLDFREAVEREIKGVRSNIWKRYLERSTYINQLNRYLDYFEKDSMSFILFSELINNKDQVLDDLFRFLGVDRTYVAELSDGASKNPTRRPISRTLRYKTNSIFGKSIVSKIEQKINRRIRAGYPKMQEALRRRLVKYFEQYNKRLSKVTGLDVSLWNE